MAIYGGSDSAGDTSWVTTLYQNVQANQNKRKVDAAFSKFTPQWYQQRAAAYTASAMPQLQQQYDAQRKNLTYALANRGLQSGSAANEQFTNLGNEMTRQKQNIVNAGQQMANQLKQQIANTQTSLYALGGTPGGTSTNAALQTASQYTAPNWTAPLTDYMQSFNTSLFNRMALSGAMTPTASAGSVEPYSSPRYAGFAIPKTGSEAYTVND